MGRKICLFVMMFLLFCQVGLCNTAPFPGGEVTSPFGEQNHFGHTHIGADIGTLSGTKIIAPHSGSAEHGSGGGYIYWCMITFEDGSCLFFGDCDEATLNCPVGSVAEGALIGITGGDEYDGPLGVSTGPHTHVEYWPTGYWSGAPDDPCPILISLGVDLTGNVLGPGGFGNGGHSGSGGSSENFGADDVSLPWKLELLYNLGDNFNKLIKTFVDASNAAFDRLYHLCFSFMLLLAIIDFTLPFLLSGMTFSPKTFVEKLLKYSVLFMAFLNWNTIINNFLIQLITAFSGTFTNNSEIIAANMSQPQLLFQKCIGMVTPGLNLVSTFTGLNFIKNFGPAIFVMLVTFLTIAVYLFLALYVVITYIDFYITAALSVMTIPFATLGHTKFLAEGTAGHLLTATFKMIFVSIFVAFAIVCIHDAKPGNIFTAMRISGVTVDSLTNYCVMCCSLIGLAALALIIPPKMANLLGGPIELGK